MSEPEPKQNLDLLNTEIAFSNKSDKELKKTAWLFKWMNNPNMVKIGSKLGLFAIKFKLPFTETVIRNTIFPQFCGGESLLDCQKVIDKLYEYDTLTILDYGAEGKSDEDDLDTAMKETLKAIEMAASNNSVPVVSTKITGLVDNLEKLHNKETISEGDQRKFQHLYERIDEICNKASELGVSIFVDAEESWLQDPIDELVMQMMEKYNKERVTVYNTYQLYNTIKLEHMIRDHKRCLDKGVLFGSKMVRGAYMEKEELRAKQLAYENPIQTSKENTDKDYNDALRFAINNIEQVAVCVATHNEESTLLATQLMQQKNLPNNHPHVHFSQLLGMSDHISFNIAKENYNSSKYMPYGPVKDVIPYLIRRAQENTSVAGQMGRELKLLKDEVRRRKLFVW